MYYYKKMQNIWVVMVKRTISKILIIALTIGHVLFLSSCGANTPCVDELSSLVANAILSDNYGQYQEGECSGEGHKVLGCDVSGNFLKVYALTMYGNYGFQNDMFIKISGSGVIPAVFTYKYNGENYELINSEYPMDGTEYIKSIKRMFPVRYRTEALNGYEAYDELRSMEQGYARDYLKSIGRDVEIGEYRDLDIVLLTDVGVSTDVSNKLTCDKNLERYPYWIGSEEFIENGVRYVRSLSFNDKECRIIFSTYEKETGAVVESFIFDSETGKAVEINSPEDVDDVTKFQSKQFKSP